MMNGPGRETGMMIVASCGASGPRPMVQPPTVRLAACGYARTRCCLRDLTSDHPARTTHRIAAAPRRAENRAHWTRDTGPADQPRPTNQAQRNATMRTLPDSRVDGATPARQPRPATTGVLATG
jgi:hypothetical protein